MENNEFLKELENLKKENFNLNKEILHEIQMFDESAKNFGFVRQKPSFNIANPSEVRVELQSLNTKLI